jgi:uncharacterized protein YqfB (UPF0267 family)
MYTDLYYSVFVLYICIFDDSRYWSNIDLYYSVFVLHIQTLDELTNDAVPENIRLQRNLHLEKPYSKIYTSKQCMYSFKACLYYSKYILSVLSI